MVESSLVVSHVCIIAGLIAARCAIAGVFPSCVLEFREFHRVSHAFHELVSIKTIAACPGMGNCLPNANCLSCVTLCNMSGRGLFEVTGLRVGDWGFADPNNLSERNSLFF